MSRCRECVFVHKRFHTKEDKETNEGLVWR